MLFGFYRCARPEGIEQAVYHDESRADQYRASDLYKESLQCRKIREDIRSAIG